MCACVYVFILAKFFNSFDAYICLSGDHQWDKPGQATIVKVRV